jgi:eukaryotic-like serine/threonine-protein kinase
MKKLHLRHLFWLPFCLCLLMSCTTGQTPAKQPASDNCTSPGKTTIVHNTSLPSTQGDWPLFHATSMRDGAAPSATGDKLTLAWSFCTRAPIFSSPVVQNGVVYVASNDGTLSALNIANGKRLWQLATKSAFFSTPIVQGATIYAGTVDGTFYALDTATGKVRWQQVVNPKGAKIWSSPVISAGLLIFGTASQLSESPKLPGQLLALDTDSGKVRWRTYIEPNGAPGGGVWSSPAVDGTTVYVATGDPDDGVQAFSLQDGHLLWHWRSVAKDVADTDIGGGPTLYRDTQNRLRVAVGGKDGKIYSLDARTGRVLWRTTVGDQVYSSPAFMNGTLYVVGVCGHTSTVQALSADTGTSRWQHSAPVIVYASPAIAAQALYQDIGNGFVTGDGGMQVLKPSDGSLLQYVDLHSGVSSSAAVLPSWLFVGAHNGNLYAFTH